MKSNTSKIGEESERGGGAAGKGGDQEGGVVTHSPINFFPSSPPSPNSLIYSFCLSTSPLIHNTLLYHFFHFTITHFPITLPSLPPTRTPPQFPPLPNTERDWSQAVWSAQHYLPSPAMPSLPTLPAPRVMPTRPSPPVRSLPTHYLPKHLPL